MLRVFVLVALSVLLWCRVEDAEADVSCTMQTLVGTYIMSAFGTEGSDFSAFAGMIAYDGKGKYIVRIRFGGPSEETRQDYGTYALVGPCEVEAVSRSGRSAHYFIDPSGEVFRYVMTSGGRIVGDAQRISREVIFE